MLVFVELVVVIAIMAAMLLPALSATKKGVGHQVQALLKKLIAHVDNVAGSIKVTSQSLETNNIYETTN